MTSAAAPAGTRDGPLASPMFRALWIATIVSNIGTWMNDVGSSWLMTSLSPSPLWVAMVQAATTLPMFLFALPGSTSACRTAWDRIISAQLDARTKPCNLANLKPRLKE